MTPRQIAWAIGAACNALVGQAAAYVEIDMRPMHWVILIGTTIGAGAIGLFAKRDSK